MASRSGDRYRVKTKEHSTNYEPSRTHSHRHLAYERSKPSSYRNDRRYSRKSPEVDYRDSKMNLTTENQSHFRKSSDFGRKPRLSLERKSTKSTKSYEFTEKKLPPEDLKLLTGDTPFVLEHSNKQSAERHLDDMDTRYRYSDFKSGLKLSKDYETICLHESSGIKRQRRDASESEEIAHLDSYSYPKTKRTTSFSSPPRQLKSSKYDFDDSSLLQMSPPKLESSKSFLDKNKVDTDETSDQCYSWVGEYLDEEEDEKELSTQNYLNKSSGIFLKDRTAIPKHDDDHYLSSYLFNRESSIDSERNRDISNIKSSDVFKVDDKNKESLYLGSFHKPQALSEQRTKQNSSSTSQIAKWPSEAKVGSSSDRDISLKRGFDADRKSSVDKKQRRTHSRWGVKTDETKPNDDLPKQSEINPSLNFTDKLKQYQDESLYLPRSSKHDEQTRPSRKSDKSSYEVKDPKSQLFEDDFKTEALHHQRSSSIPIRKPQAVIRTVVDSFDPYKVSEPDYSQQKASHQNKIYSNEYRLKKSSTSTEGKRLQDELPTREIYDRNDQRLYDDKYERHFSRPVLQSDIEVKYMPKTFDKRETVESYQSTQDIPYADQRKKLLKVDKGFLIPQRQFADRRQIHDNLSKINYAKESVETADDILHLKNTVYTPELAKHDLNHKSLNISQNKSSISDFQGAWKAATNSSIEVADNYNLQKHNTKQLVKALNVVKAPAKLSFTTSEEEYKKKQSNNFISGHENDTSYNLPTTNLHPDKREVLYSSDRDNSFRVETPSHSATFINKRRVISQSQRHFQLNKDTKVSKDISVDEAEEMKQVKKSTIANRDVEFWGKDFVDWFSKHILPTPMFQSYMDNYCLKMTASDLAVMPMNFLQHLEDGDYHAIKCIPKTQSEAKTLLSFLNRFKNLKDTALGIKEEIRSAVPTNEITNTRAQPSEYIKMSSTVEIAGDACIPVHISGNSVLDAKQSLRPAPQVESNTPRPSTFSSTTVSNLVITCSNSTNNNIIDDAGNVTSNNTLPSRIVVNQFDQPIQSSPETCLENISKQETSDLGTSVVSESNITKSTNLVDPRWNEEVQQFIGRAQSSSSRPIYLEYLERSNQPVPSVDSNSDSSSKFLKHNDDQRLPYSRSDDSNNDWKRRTKPGVCHDSRRSHIRSSSRTILRNHTSNSKERNDRVSRTSGDNASAKKEPKANSFQNPTKKTLLGGVSQLSVKVDEKQSKSVASSKTVTKKSSSYQSAKNPTTETSRKDSKERTKPSRICWRSRSISPSQRRRSSSSQQSRHSQKSNSESVFGTNTKRTIRTEKIHFQTKDKIISNNEELRDYKRFFKNLAFKCLNLLYDFEQYDYDKIILIIREAEAKFSQSSKHHSCTRMQSLYILKQLFEDNTTTNIQVNLKRKLAERGKDWNVIALQAFQVFQSEVFSACDKGLSKNIPLGLQSKRSVQDIVEKYEQLFPQFCGDVKYLVQLWIWKTNAVDCRVSPDDDYLNSLKAAWKENNEKTNNDVKVWLRKFITSPLYDTSVRIYFSVLSVLQSQLDKSREDAVDVMLMWWMEGYFHRRYHKFGIKQEVSKSPSSEMKFLNDEVMIVIDEDDETHDSPPDDAITQGTDQADDTEKEYAEDASGAPTILLY